MAYSLPFFMASDIWEQGRDDTYITLRFIATFMCFLLIIKDFWPEYLTKYLPIYWYATLTICLPVLMTYMMLLNGVNTLWLINLSLVLFLLSVLVDWKSFLIIMLIGILGGIVIYSLSYDLVNISFSFGSYTYFLISYITIFSIIIGIIFSRNREYFSQKLLKIKNGLNEKLEQKVHERTEDLTKALSAKKDFLNNVSHEIRTPLQGILGISQGLSENWYSLKDDEKKKLLDKVTKNSDRLISLVSNLLDLSKLESEKIIFNFVPTDIITLVKETIDEFNHSFNNYDIILRNKLGYESKNILVDPLRISQVIRALLSNACKFAQEPNIIIELENFIDKNNKKYIKISVIDYGIGIPKDELEIIFEPFFEGSRTRNKAGGTGLGLAIAKQIIMGHKGKIKAISHSHKNNYETCLFFLLPDYLDKDPISISKINKSLNILVIDDEDACICSARLLLESLGHNVTSAYGGIEALEILANVDKKFDLVFLDLMMPDIYGINVLKEIKNNKKYKNLTIIIQSGIADEAEIEKAYSFGAADFISKPYVKADIKEKINKYINK